MTTRTIPRARSARADPSRSRPALAAMLSTLMSGVILAASAQVQGPSAQSHPLPCALPGNCVNSASEGLAPLVYPSDDPARGLALLRATLTHFPEASISRSEPLQLVTIFRTTLGFQDEVIFMLEPGGQRIQFRSRSLMGRYDFGKNRARMLAVAARFRAEAAASP